MDNKISTKIKYFNIFIIPALLILFAAMPVHAYDYAVTVEAFVQGTTAVANYDDSGTALGLPSLETPAWGGGNQDVTMFVPPWATDQIVSIGAGGYLTLSFDHHVMDDANNPYGMDLLVFGNSMLIDTDWPSGVTGTGYSSEPGNISVSQDGTTWFDIPDVYADDLFPTLGYTNTSGPNAADGTIPSDFTKPVNPDIAWQDSTYSEIVALYDGSGGGTGVDIADAVDGSGVAADLAWIQYIKIWQNSGDVFSTEIDAVMDVAAVPIPGAVWLLVSGMIGLIGSRKYFFLK